MQNVMKGLDSMESDTGFAQRSRRKYAHCSMNMADPNLISALQYLSLHHDLMSAILRLMPTRGHLFGHILVTILADVSVVDGTVWHVSGRQGIGRNLVLRVG